MSATNEYEPVITCPICGWKNPDSWEFVDDGGEGTCECPKCGATLTVTRHIFVSYSASTKGPAEKP